MPNDFTKKKVDQIKQQIDDVQAASPSLEDIASTELEQEALNLSKLPSPEEIEEKNSFLGPKVDPITSVPGEVYEQVGLFEPASQVFSAPGKDKVKLGVQKDNARPAEELDLAHLSEADIMNIPQIRAADYDTLAFIDKVKPKDPGVRFRWVYSGVPGQLGNNAGPINVSRHKLQWGFSNASVEDIDDGGVEIGRSLLAADGTIRYYDIMLMKVPVLHLMALYKRSILKGNKRLENIGKQSNALTEQTFNELIAMSPGLQAALRTNDGYKVSFGN